MKNIWYSINHYKKSILISLLVLIFLFSVTGFFVLPPLLKSIITGKIKEHIGRDVSIGQIRFNPYTLTAKVRGLSITDRGSPEVFLSCDEILVNLEGLSIFKMALVMKELKLTKPYIKVVRKKDFTYNFSDLLETKKEDGEKKKGTPTTPLRFSLNNITVENGSIDFIDEPKGTKHTVRDMRIGIPFISNIPSDVEKYVQPFFSATINDAPYVLKGKTKPFSDSLETTFDVKIKDLDMVDYFPYLPFKTKFVLPSGSLDVEGRISYIQSKKAKPSLTVEGNVSIKDLMIGGDKKQNLLGIALLNIQMLPSEVFSKTFHISKVYLESPYVLVEREKDGGMNLKALIPEGDIEKNVEKEKSDKPSDIKLQVDDVTLSKGRIEFSDRSLPEHFKTVLAPLDLSVKGFSNKKEAKATYKIEITTESKEKIGMEGLFSIDPIQSEGNIKLASISIKKYSPFYNDLFPFIVESGYGDIATSYRFKKGVKDAEIDLSDLALSIKDIKLKLNKTEQEFLKLQEFSIKNGILDLNKKEVHLGSIVTKRGWIMAKRLEGGDLDIVKSLSKTKKEEDKSPIPKEENKPKEDKGSWKFLLHHLFLDDYSLTLTDASTPIPARMEIQKIKITGENIGNERDKKGKISSSCLINKKGRVFFEGRVSPIPLSAELKVDVDNVEVIPFQPYFMDKVNIMVTGGSVSTKGQVSLLQKDEDLNFSFKGDGILSRFSSIDRLDGKEMVNLDSLSLNDVNVHYKPLSLHIKGVSLSDFYAFVYINREGRLNLIEAFKKEAPQEDKEKTTKAKDGQIKIGEDIKTPSGEDKKAEIRIDDVSLVRGSITFHDSYIKPEFSATLSEMTGRVTGLSSKTGSTGDVEFLAKLNNFAPIEIKGRINPFQKDLFVDISAKIKDLDLSPATPYSGKYVGYTIEKGKLSYEAKYSIVERKIDAENRVFIDQFTFGDRVDSPHATNLPVRLAIALLKDRNGRINLELPVTGSLDDPKFSIGKIILQIIINIIVKAVTSPFALLGAIFGGGEELSYIEFDYGSASITESAMKKITSIRKALSDRPSLNLEIEGHVDGERDRDGLKVMLLKRKVKLQKLNEMMKRNMAKVPVDDVPIEEGEYQRYLRMAYRAEKFPKPRNIIGMVKDIPVAEMEKLMLTHIEVTEGDLRNLASNRAMRVKEEILKTEGIGSERIFIVEPKSLVPDRKPKIKESRVDLKLK
ncbi:MAG: DUF748 domain-containing protein [Syntrophorhabdaceae bacterium]|nr:DUF748 domain-containing protein [Syntrophorhabdaceae bacterium]